MNAVTVLAVQRIWTAITFLEYISLFDHYIDLVMSKNNSCKMDDVLAVVEKQLAKANLTIAKMSLDQLLNVDDDGDRLEFFFLFLFRLGLVS